jgi:hypothetical protein
VRFLALCGLNSSEGRQIFEQMNQFSGSETEWQELIEFYNGNPLALKLTACHIQDLFGGDITKFLNVGQPIFADIRELLDWHFYRLSDQEKELLYWLAIYREPIGMMELKDDLISLNSQLDLAETLQSLERKLILEKSNNRKQFTLSNMLIKYIMGQIIRKITEELEKKDLNIFNPHALRQKSSQNYVTPHEIRMIIELKQYLLGKLKNQQHLETYLKLILYQNQEKYPLNAGYIGGNIINLLCHLPKIEN